MSEAVKPEHPEDVPQPLLHCNRGVHAQESEVDFEPGEDSLTIVVWLKDADKLTLEVQASEQSIILLCDECDPRLRQSLEMPRAIRTETLTMERTEDRLRLHVEYQEEHSSPPTLPPGGPPEEPVKHPRSEVTGQ